MCAPTIKRKRAREGGGRKWSRKEEKVSHRIFLFVCFAILYFIVAVVVVVHNEQNRAHDMHDTYYPIEWVLEDKLLFPMLLRKTHTVCGWALVSLCVLACDVSVSIQISVRIEAGFVFPPIFLFACDNSENLSSLYFVSIVPISPIVAWSLFQGMSSPNEHVRYHSPFTIPIYLLIYHIIFFSFFSFFLCFTRRCVCVVWSVLR